MVRPRGGILQALTDGTPRAAQARLLLAASVALPLLLGWARALGERAGYYDAATGGALVTGFTILAFAGLVSWHAARTWDADAALAESERRFRATFEKAGVGLVLSSPEGRWLWVNDKLCAMVGYAPDELLRKDFTLTHPDDLQGDVELARRVAEGELAGYALEKRMRRKDGSLVWVRVTVSLVRDAGGEPAYFIAVLEDVSDRKAAEATVARQALELGRSNQELEQFASVAAHDLQEPLRMVASYADLLALRYKDRLDPEADQFLRFIKDGVVRMRGLIDDLLALSRIGTRARPPERVELEALLARTLADLRVAISEAGAAVSHDPLPAVLGDPRQLGQLLPNLIGNALKFRGSRPPLVHLSAELGAEGWWVVSVRDNGIGIAPQHHEKVFQIFQRLHSRREYPGTGIGLALCKKVVERAGGRIWVESEPGQGSVFKFTLPPAAEPAIQERSA